MPGRTKIEKQKAEIGLRLLEAPWDSEGRDYVVERMEQLGMSHDDLYYELRKQGWEGDRRKAVDSLTLAVQIA